LAQSSEKRSTKQRETIIEKRFRSRIERRTDAAL
jgi:hypothetical protein